MTNKNYSFVSLEEMDKRYFENNPDAIRTFLNVALQDFIENQDKAEFLRAVGLAVKWGGVTNVAKHSRMTRQGVYKAVKPNANPSFTTIVNMLHSVGLDFKIV